MVKKNAENTEEKKELPQLGKLITDLNKKFGNNAISLGFPKDDGGLYKSIERISTGSISLDIALGGGLPLGRFIELSGGYSSTKTTQSLHMVREAQKHGLTCAFLDIEGTTDEAFCGAIGVDFKSLLYSRPDSMEEALQLLVDLQKSGVVHFAVLDSIAACMASEKELESSMDETVRMGIPQQLFGEYFRKFNMNNNRLVREGNRPFTVIGINQIREKIGCFHYTARVLLSDGNYEMIGKIVNQKLPLEVMAYNPETGNIEPKKITNWFNNGTQEENFTTLFFDSIGGNGIGSYLPCTPNHRILTPTGYVEAKDLKVGDKSIQFLRQWVPSEVQESFIIGSLLGDGCIRKAKKGSYSFRYTHCKEQREYSEWKSNFFDGNFRIRLDGVSEYSSKTSGAYEKFRHHFYHNDVKKRYVPTDIVLDPLSLAIWYQDDGYLGDSCKLSVNFCTNCFCLEAINTLCQALRNVGIESKFHRIKKENHEEYVITLGRKQTKMFFDLVAPYIHPSMAYKVIEGYECGTALNTLDMGTKNYGWVKREAVLTKKSTRNLDKHHNKYDIEVEGNHNYIVSDVVVHNSYGDPEYTPGGRAKEFASSIIIRLRRGDWITEGYGESKEVVGQVTKFKIEKNKTYRRMQTGEFDFYFSKNGADIREFHNDNYKEVIVCAVEWGVIERAGAWFKYKDKKYQGLPELVKTLRSDKNLINSLKDEIMEIALRKID